MEDIDYNIWVDKERTPHDISSMSDLYIKNCIKFCQDGVEKAKLERCSLLNNRDYFEESPETNNSFEYMWFYLYGDNYISIFKKELMRREINNV